MIRRVKTWGAETATDVWIAAMPIVAVVACFGYLSFVLYAALFQWPVESARWLWGCFARGFRKEAHPMALKGFLIAALCVILFALAWMVLAVWCLYNGWPRVADAMNDLAAVAVIAWVARVELRRKRD